MQPQSQLPACPRRWERITTQTPITLNQGISLTADTKVSLTTGGLLEFGANAQGVTASTVITAGTFKTAPNGLVKPTDIATAGAVIGVGLRVRSDCCEAGAGYNNLFIANGGNVTFTATGGDADLGTSSTFRSVGGNVIILAKGNVITENRHRYCQQPTPSKQ